MSVKQLIGALFATVLAVPVFSSSAAQENELQGTWKIVEVTEKGEKLEVENMEIVFEGSNLISKRAGKIEDKGIFVVDNSKQPHHIDVKVTESPLEVQKGKTMKGIYEVKGNTLRLCFSRPGKEDRPQEFSSTATSNTGLVTLVRAKK